MMGKEVDLITDKHAEFIIRQQLFFTATATADSRINLSPKGLDSLRIINPRQVVWLNLTGSGNETAAHLLEDGRITLMFCAFEGEPKILRLYGHATAHHEGSEAWEAHIGRFPRLPGARQIIVMEVEQVGSSCGFGVPLFDYVGQREMLSDWAEKKSDMDIKEYWATRNNLSIDGKPTDFA
jgi:hypothetical protein